MLNPVEFLITDADRKILELMVNENLSVKDIAETLKRGQGTIKSHLTRIYYRAGLKGSKSAKRIALARILRPEIEEWTPPNCHLTEFQWLMVRMISEAMTNAEIAAVLGKGEQVIKNNVLEIYDLTGMSSRLELSDWYARHRPRVMAAAASSQVEARG